MSVAIELEQLGIEEYLRQQQHKSLLKFLTCGSVDDGKSTLIGRLLYDSESISTDILEMLTRQSKTSGENAAIDLALLTDGLRAEREQGIVRAERGKVEEPRQRRGCAAGQQDAGRREREAGFARCRVVGVTHAPSLAPLALPGKATLPR
mgnify:CR=1 FL=1